MAFASFAGKCAYRTIVEARTDKTAHLNPHRSARGSLTRAGAVTFEACAEDSG